MQLLHTFLFPVIHLISRHSFESYTISPCFFSTFFSCFKYIVQFLLFLPLFALYLPFLLSRHHIVPVFPGKPFAGKLSEYWYANSPTQPFLITSQLDKDTLGCLLMCVFFVFISTALFRVEHLSPECDFVSVAHHLALESGQQNPFGGIMDWAGKCREWWSRLWSESLALSSASSHYTANTHTGSVASLVLWIRPDFYLVSWELANSYCPNQYGRQTVWPRIYICWAVDQFSYNTLGRGEVRFRLL